MRTRTRTTTHSQTQTLPSRKRESTRNQTSSTQPKFVPFSGEGHRLGGEVPKAPPLPTLKAPTRSPAQASTGITPDSLLKAKSKLRQVTQVHAGSDLQHIHIARGSTDSSSDSAQGYIGLIGQNPVRQFQPHPMAAHHFVDYFTDVRRELANLRAPVPLVGGLHVQSEGDRLAQSVEGYGASRAQHNINRAAGGRAPLPNLDVVIGLGANASYPNNGPDSFTPGRGTGSTIGFDPITPVHPGGDVPGELMVPPSILLGHELIHSRAMQQGRRHGNYMQEEFQTVGLRGNRRFTENQLRAERQYLPRVRSGGNL